MSKGEQPVTDKYEFCNHYHEIAEGYQELVDLGTGPFVADIKMLPLLKAFNAIGITTLSHNYDYDSGQSWVVIDAECFDRIEICVRTREHMDREGKREMLICWEHPESPCVAAKSVTVEDSEG